MGRYARKKQHKGNKVLRLFKTKHKTKDLDEIHEDLKKGRKEGEPDPDLPGEGKHYCLTCAVHFIDESAVKDHMKSKRHKRRMKKLEVEPYTQEEADRAAGMGSYIAPKRQKLAQQKPTDSKPQDMDDDEDDTRL